MDFLGTAGTVLNLANSAKSLFGGGGKSQSDMMEEQVGWNYHQAEFLPAYQMKGYRRAGLNPILLAGKGPQQGPMPSQNAVDDRSISTARQLAGQQAALIAAQVENLHANTENTLAQKANVNVNSAKQASEIAVLQQEAPLRNAQHNAAQAQAGLFTQQAEESYERSRFLVQQVVQSKADTARSMADRDRIIEQKNYTQVEIQQAQQILKGQLLEGQIDETKFGDAMRHLRRLSQSITGLGSIGREIQKGGR